MIELHGGALEYDLVTLTGYTLDDIGGALPWRALSHFIAGLGPGSRLYRAAHPEEAEMEPWLDGSMAAALLADMYDLLNAFRWQFESSQTKRKTKRPRPYQRPWMGDEARGIKRIGSGAVPLAAFDEWWDGRMKDTGGAGDGD